MELRHEWIIEGSYFIYSLCKILKANVKKGNKKTWTLTNIMSFTKKILAENTNQKQLPSKEGDSDLDHLKFKKTCNCPNQFDSVFLSAIACESKINSNCYQIKFIKKSNHEEIDHFYNLWCGNVNRRIYKLFIQCKYSSSI